MSVFKPKALARAIDLERETMQMLHDMKRLAIAAG
jgi:hypothetical protein